MDYKTAINFIRSKFNTDITVAESIKTKFPNQKFDTPDEEMWVTFNIIAGEGTKISIGAPGNNRHRVIGNMVAQIFAPINVGDGAANELAVTISDAFGSVTANGIKYMTPSYQPAGRVGDLWQLNVNCPFRFDYLK